MKQPDGSVAAVHREYEETFLGPVVHRTADRLFVLRSINLEWWRQYEGLFELMRARTLGEKLDSKWHAANLRDEKVVKELFEGSTVAV